MAYPERLLTEDESVLRDFHPHWRTLLGAGTWTVLAVAALVGAVAWLDGTVTWVVLGLAVVVWLYMAGSPFLSWLFTQYVLTNERIIVRRGIISRSSTEIPLESITNVRFTQNVFERILRYGDVLLESAGQRSQTTLHDIPDPEGFQSQVYRTREERTLSLKTKSSDARDVAAQLADLADLRDRGVLSETEFEQQKRRLLEG